MGYTTDFVGRIDVVPALSVEEITFINKFSDTRRMKRENGPYFVDGNGFCGQDDGPDEVYDHNNPPEGQPGLWCQWVATDDGSAIEWNGAEKFYGSPDWMAYLIKHFLGETPVAASQLPFLKGHVLNGRIGAQGEEAYDMWELLVNDNVVMVDQATATADGNPKRID